MPNLAYSYPAREVAGAFQALGIICTVWRVYFRVKIGRFWWEDALAVAACFSCIVAVVGQWMYLLAHGDTAIVGVWLSTLGFTFVVRGVQMSILLSIIRIVAPRPCLCKFTRACVVFFAVCWAILVIGKVWQCATQLSWHHRDPPPCLVQTEQVLIFEFISDCIVVGILIGLPLCMLWHIKLPRCQRRMILSIFASSIVLAIAAILHIVGHITDDTLLFVAAVNFEVALNIIVCNLLVVVTYLYRCLSCGDGRTVSETSSSTEDDDFTQPRRPTTRTALTMTTIEDASGGSLPTTCQYTDTSREGSVTFDAGDGQRERLHSF